MDKQAAVSQAVNQDAIAANIGRTVDKAALRKVRNLVDNFERDEQTEKAQQFKVMFFALIAIMVVAVATVFFANGGKKPERATAEAKQADARAACVARSSERQLAAMERDTRASNPTITAADLAAKLASYRPAIENSALNECKYRN
jgi:hypothetical protein